ncbi:Ig-like domain-containing protein, partial [Vibrio azureus]
VTWRSDDLTTATVTSDGLLTGVARGTTTLSAFKDNVTSNDVSVDVTDAVIDSIAVTPASMLLAKGVTQQLMATATYSDNTSSDISNLVTWRSGGLTVASVAPNGLLTAEGKGRVTLSAFKDNVTSNNVSVDVTDAVIDSITVTPASMLLAKGVTQQLTATATYSDNTSTDISGFVTWRSDDVTVASVTPDGLLTTEDKGTVMLSAVKDNVTSNRVSVEVTNAVIDSLAITPASVLLAKGQTKQLTATATYSDNTSSDVSDLVTWYSDDVTIASVTPNGLLNAEGKGTVRLSAMKDNVTSNSVSVDVTDAAIDSIAVTPVSVSIAKGLSQQLTATATYSDNTSSDISHLVTWRSDDVTVASVTPNGLLTAEDKGIVTLSAFKGNVASNSVSVDVTAALLNSITVTPASVSITEGHTQQLTAMATYSDNTSSDISNMVTWSVNNSLATVTSNGLLTAVRSGPVIVSAFKGDVTSNSVTVQVKSCSSVGGTCVNGFVFNGKILTNSPSKSFLESIGLIYPSGLNGNYIIDHSSRPNQSPSGDFLYVGWNKADELCRVHYNNKKIKGRTNWRLPTRNELLDLHNTHGNMYNSAKWPKYVEYWTSNSAPPPGFYSYVYLDGSGRSDAGHKDDKRYVSCVSD